MPWGQGYFGPVLMLQALGLATDYNSDATVKHLIHMNTALSFIQVTFLRVAWSASKQTPRTHHAGISDYIDYFKSTWIYAR